MKMVPEDQCQFLVCLTIMAVLPYLGSCIDCYVCSSVNRSDPFCEDSFNTSHPNVSYLVQGCTGYRKDRSGTFPADHCIKVSGISTKDPNYSITIRTCALDSGTLTADTEIVRMSHCGHFVFDKHYFNGCVQSCPRDGCNGSTRARLANSTGIRTLVTLLASLVLLALIA